MTLKDWLSLALQAVSTGTAFWVAWRTRDRKKPRHKK